MLGFRKTHGRDMWCSIAQVMCETTPLLRGECFSTSDTPSCVDRAYFSARLQRIYPCYTRTQHNRKVFVASDLRHCANVFIRRDSMKRPHQNPWDSSWFIQRCQAECQTSPHRRKRTSGRGINRPDQADSRRWRSLSAPWNSELSHGVNSLVVKRVFFFLASFPIQQYFTISFLHFAD